MINTTNLDVDFIIDSLLTVRFCPSGTVVQISEDDISALCQKASEIFLNQPMLLKLEVPLKICGDIHGQYYDLLRIFEKGGFPPMSNYLFLGDYVDTGRLCVETICLLLAYKIKYPEKFFVLRGNHESAYTTRHYGFYNECKKRYNLKLWKTFLDCFNCMPVAAIIEKNIFCCHGGLSRDLENLDQINLISRPTYIPESGLLCDLVWADPDKKVRFYQSNRGRGLSTLFGSEAVSEFLEKNDLDLICRAHQCFKNGYEFFADRKLVTIFSAPSYDKRGQHFNGVVMTVDATLMCSFQVLKLTSPDIFIINRAGLLKTPAEKPYKKECCSLL